MRSPLPTLGSAARSVGIPAIHAVPAAHTLDGDAPGALTTRMAKVGGPLLPPKSHQDWRILAEVACPRPEHPAKEWYPAKGWHPAKECRLCAARSAHSCARARCSDLYRSVREQRSRVREDLSLAGTEGLRKRGG
jgi:hypothetical protein